MTCYPLGNRLLPHYLSSHPDIAIRLRDLYFQKVLDAFKLNLSKEDCHIHLFPHLLVIHICVVAYVFSKKSTPAQRTPPPPLKLPVDASIVDNVTTVSFHLRDLAYESQEEGAQHRYPWEWEFLATYHVFCRSLCWTILEQSFPSWKS